MLFFQNFFQFLHDLTQLLQGIENIFFIDGIYCCFFVFLSNQENLYMIHHDWDLYYDIYNTINEYNQALYLSVIPIFFDIYFK